ncbi:MAG: nucleotidyltransferase [Bacilli bacterium]|nr:nucleotidyltransferase [Bacilli bacterium]
MAVGIICEYNPFHNGHLYHLNKAKEMFPNDEIVLVINSYFCQRGDVSFINKWDRTELSLMYGVDLVVELPFVFASQSADLFAKGAIEILNYLKVDSIVFGSEIDEIEILKKIADADTDNIKSYLDLGLSYPKSIAKAIEEDTGITLDSPNDILGVAYIKQINRLNSKIKPICIKRTNDYHSTDLKEICSASAIRKAIREKKEINCFIPNGVKEKINPIFLENYFNIIKYKILTDDVSKYQTVDEGIEYRLKKYILECEALDDFILKVKTKRYSYNKIKRMLVHILCSFTKEEAKNLKTEYIRILGFNGKGQNYLKRIKKDVDIPLLTKYKDFKNLNIEIRSTYAYISILSFDEQKQIVKREYEKIVIKKGL